MTYAIPRPMIRDVAEVARRLQADPDAGRKNAAGHFEIVVERAVREGEVCAHADADTGRLSGGTLQFPIIARPCARTPVVAYALIPNWTAQAAAGNSYSQ